MTFNLDLLTSARWFAGKGRTVVDVDVADLLEPPGSRGAAVELVDVTYADGGSERYALALRDRKECEGDDPLWTALARVAATEALATECCKGSSSSRFLAVDITNTAVVVGGGVVLKLYRRLERGSHPEVELLAALDGSPHAPALLGTLEHDGATMLVLQALVDGEQVGWEGVISRLAAGDAAVGEPAELATVTAKLHQLLAQRLGVSEGDLSRATDFALDGDLASLAGRIQAGLAPLERAVSRVQRVHGDLHVAQFLRTRDGLVVVDWEGEPTLSLSDRARPRSALRDLASLRLSLAHAARAAHRRNDGFDWRAWSVAARREALDAYADVAGPVDGELLHALELEKELSELSYAERWLPEWLYAPRAVLPFILDEAA